MALKEVTTRMLDTTKKFGGAKLETVYYQQWRAKGVSLKKKYRARPPCSSWGASGSNSGKGRHKEKKSGPTQENNTVMVVGPTGKIRFTHVDN